jgi:hypothetical protein
VRCFPPEKLKGIAKIDVYVYTDSSNGNRAGFAGGGGRRAAVCARE